MENSGIGSDTDNQLSPTSWSTVNASDNPPGPSTEVMASDDSNEALEIDQPYIKKMEWVFKIYYNYMGHIKGAPTKFKAKCSNCNQVYSFDNHNFAGNAKRHYQKVHKNIKWNEKSNNHAMTTFYKPTAIKQLTERDPLQKAINDSYLDMICVDGLPLSVTTGLGFKHLVYKLNSMVRPTSRTGLTRILDSRFAETVSNHKTN